jgi:hypothetical protein
MNEKLKSYLSWTPEEIENHFDGEENHILNYDPYDCPEDANITQGELKIVESYALSHGRLPVIGRLTSVNSEGEYPWRFDGPRAKGGYRGESLNVDYESNKIQPCGRYLLGGDVESMINCLVSSLFTDCRVGVAEECALWGWIYVVDLQNGLSYYGLQNTIFPPNHEDGDGKTLEEVLREKDQFITEYPHYLEFTGQQ